MKLTQVMVAMATALAALVGHAGESAEFRLDTMDGPRTARAVETIAYSAAWNDGYTVIVAVDGVKIKDAFMTTGDVIWNAAESGPGTHTLTHTCDGETLTAVFEVASDVHVRFYANGGEFRNGNTGEKVKVFDQYFTYGGSQKLFTDDLVPQKPGNEFLGWSRGTPEVDSARLIIEGRAEKTWYDDVTEERFYAVWSSTVTVTYGTNNGIKVPPSLVNHLFWSVDGNIVGNSVVLKSGESAQVGPGVRTVTLRIDNDKYKRFVENVNVQGRVVSMSGANLKVNVSNDFQDSAIYGDIPYESEYPISVAVGPRDDRKCDVRFECANESVSGHVFSPSDADITLTYYGPDGNSEAAVLEGIAGDGTQYALPWGVYKVEGKSRDGKWVMQGISELVLAETTRTVHLNFFYTGAGGGKWEAGVIASGFAKAQTVTGALYKDNALAGTVEVKVGKINAKKNTVKISASATMIVGGKAKKVTAKTINPTLADDGTLLCELMFNEPIGKMSFVMYANGVFTLANATYRMVKMKVGGNWTKTDARVYVDMTIPVLPVRIITELLPGNSGVWSAGEPVIPKGGKWSFNKNATVKLSKYKIDLSKDETAYMVDYTVDDKNGKTNLSSMKLTYTPKTGIFKGSFKLYALEGEGKKTKLKKYTVDVIGFVVDGKGHGEATCKKPKLGPWTVTVE